MKADVLQNSKFPFLLFFLVTVLLLLVAHLLQDWNPALPLDQAALAILFVLFLYFSWKLLVMAGTWHGRRYFLSVFNRLWRWEFWPPWAFYPPVALYYCYLSLRFRSFTLPSLANPGIPLGGWFESKADLLQLLAREHPEKVGKILVLTPHLPIAAQLETVRKFQEELEAPWPLAVKPDLGERGRAVKILHDSDELRTYLEGSSEKLTFQEFHPGKEFGVFFIRHPEKREGAIFSLTEKCPVTVVGNGIATLEDLILQDSRAVCKASQFMRRFPHAKTWIPPSGEVVKLTLLGSHNQGTLFLDRSSLSTPELARCFTHITRALPGFYFGRFDVKAPSLEDLLAGRGIRILEVNGVTSEPINIFHPFNSLWSGYRVVFRLWKTAFEFGNYHRQEGLRPPPLRVFLRTLWLYLFRKEEFVLPDETPGQQG